MYQKRVIKVMVFSFLLALVKSEDNETESEKCDSDDSFSCVEQDLFRYVNNLEEKSSFPVVGDYVTLVKKDGALLETPRASEDIIERCLRFLANHELRLKLPSEEARSLFAEARTRKIRRLLLPILLLLKVKAIVLIVVISVIALIAFTGFGAGLVALALSGATALKSLLENTGSSKISYEIVPPVSPHWSRAGSESVQPLSPYAQPLQYE